jgi:aminoglycoside phosphotransferase (APT) family kinase protein
MHLPEPTPVSPAAVAAILARHGLRGCDAAVLPHPGGEASIYLLDDDLVLRVPRQDALACEGVRREAVAVPLVRAAGVRAPELIVFDQTGDLLPVPYTIYARLPGVSLDRLALAPAATPQVWRELGHDLALLHGLAVTGPAGQLWPEEPEDNPDPRPWAADLAAAGVFSPPAAAWLMGWLDRLTPLAQVPVPLRFGHGDVQTGNLMVLPESLVYIGLLDWSGASWRDPLRDFWAVSPWAVPFILEGYRAVAAVEDEATVRERIAWRHAQLGLYFLWRDCPPDGIQFAPRAQRLMDGLRFLLESPPNAW